MEGLSHPPNTPYTSATTCKHAQTTHPPTQPPGFSVFWPQDNLTPLTSNSLVEEIQNSEEGAVTLSG